MRNQLITIVALALLIALATVAYAATPSAVTVLKPNGAEKITTGYEVNWTNSSDSNRHFVKYHIYYSSDSGSTWNKIVHNWGFENDLNSSNTIENITFTGNQNRTVWINVPKVANVTIANFNVTPFQRYVGYGTYYQSAVNEPGTDGTADADGNVGCFGAWQTTLIYQSKILVSADVGATITNISLNAADYTSNNAFSHLTYNITACSTAATNMTSTGMGTADADCNVTVSTLLDQIWNSTFAAMSGSGNNRWFTFHLQHSYTMQAGMNYIIHFKYLSGAIASKTNRFKCRYDTNSAVNAKRSCYGTTSGCTIQTNQIQNTKLFAKNMSSPSNVFIDVGATDASHELSHTGTYTTENKTSNLASQMDFYINNTCTAASSANCSIPLLFHSNTQGIMQISNIEVSYTDFWWNTTALTGKSTYRINVTPTDNTVNGTGDISNADFTIDSSPPSVAAINSPSSNRNISSNYVINYTIVDNVAVTNAYFAFGNGTGNYSASGVVGWTRLPKHSASNYFNYTVATANFKDGTYRIWVNASDAVPNSRYNSTRYVTVDNLAPRWSNTGTNNTQANHPTRFYARWTDIVALSGYRFSTNNTGSWINNSFAALSGTASWSNVTKVLNSTPNSVVGWRVYANDSNNVWNATTIQKISTVNTVPTASSPIINSSDKLNYTNSSISRYFTYSDANGHTQSNSYTKWYKSNVYQASLDNKTIILAGNTTRGDNWAFKVKVYDGYGWSSWSSYANLTIRNAPQTIRNITVTPNATGSSTTVTIGAFVVDEDSQTNVTAYVQAPDETDASSVNLALQSGYYYKGTHTVQNQGSNIVDIVTYDQSDRNEYDNAAIIAVKDNGAVGTYAANRTFTASTLLTIRATTNIEVTATTSSTISKPLLAAEYSKSTVSEPSDVSPLNRYAEIVVPSALNNVLSARGIKFYYSHKDLSDASLSEESLEIRRWNGNGWGKLESFINSGDNTVASSVSSFGLFGVFGAKAPVSSSSNSAARKRSSQEAAQNSQTVETQVARKVIPGAGSTLAPRVAIEEVPPRILPGDSLTAKLSLTDFLKNFGTGYAVEWGLMDATGAIVLSNLRDLSPPGVTQMLVNLVTPPTLITGEYTFYAEVQQGDKIVSSAEKNIKVVGSSAEKYANSVYAIVALITVATITIVAFKLRKLGGFRVKKYKFNRKLH